MGGGGRYERDDVDRILYPVVFLLLIRWDDFHPHPNVKAGHPEVFSISLPVVFKLCSARREARITVPAWPVRHEISHFVRRRNM